ncbi:OLC1v1025796C3 [Oldenlandia corymbosa var. corymbosa]|uniref:OLC1v1025796C3 n=1 Tax=Oldenlandia corymbosa var. corymbosa TaxID=529605 RepID=A0AAV1C8F5_OLDCO|nr:OLC1v1025796C3 [Oldenlandia corymbosa var. corymbosa]
MIGGEEIYKVVTAMLPLYTAIFLGYASVKWCQMFKPDQCDAINRFNCYFVLPFFTFEFVATVNPYQMNFRFMAADVIAKNAKTIASESKSIHSTHRTAPVDVESGEIEMEETSASVTAATIAPTKRLKFWGIMKVVLLKLAKNPNVYACVLGLIWALISKRWHIGMPKIIEGSILIMSKGGAGLAMFSMGLFMALEEKIIACGMGLTLYGMVLRFVVGPATTAIGALATGLRGNVLRIVVVQAALPQALTAFVYAQEYGLHAQVLSTAVIFGTIVSLPLLIGYYAVLDVWH